MPLLPLSVSSRSVRLFAHRIPRALLLRESRAAAIATAAQPLRRRALRGVPAYTLWIGILMAILIGIAGDREGRAQSRTGTDLAYLAKVLNLRISNDCGQYPPTGGENSKGLNQLEWMDCATEVRAQLAEGLGLALGSDSSLVLLNRQRAPLSGSTPLRRSSAESAPQADPPFAYTLNSSTPGLPFLGNRLVVFSFVINAASLADATAEYSAGLARQSNCSLDEDLIDPYAATPNAANITSLTGAQDYFHQLSGLTTTPDVFANGCTPQVLGLPASNNILLLGQTSDGAAINAELADNGLFVTIADPTTNTFTTTQITTGSDPGAFYAASLRSNGIMDLVETGLTDPVTQQPATAVLLGNGDGTFKTPVYYDVSANSFSLGAGFTVDDVNGDGIPDIVVLNGTIGVYNGTVLPVTGTVTTLIGKGDGTFTIGPVSNLTWTDSLQVLTGVFKTGDVKDLLVGGTVLFGAGDGSFTQGPTNNALAMLSVDTAAAGGNAVGSFRNNGKLDVAATVPGFVSIFYGNGDGTFQTGPSYAALPDFMQVTITDIDGDGNPDIVLGTSSGGVFLEGGYDTLAPEYQILMGRGDGTFADSPVYTLGSYGVPASSNLGQLEIASADFNGDDETDVLVFNRSNGITTNSLLMLPGDGTGALGTAVASPIDIAPVMLVAAKMNHDTLADAVLVGNGQTANPQLSVLFNQGNGTFAGEQDYSLAGTPVSLAVGDFNGDGIPDVAVGESGQGVFVLFGQSDGTLGTPVQVDTSASPIGLAAGSLTTDGRTDLVVADQATGTLHVYLGNANDTFTSKTAPTTGATNLSVAALGDLNNSGKLDLIVAGFIPGSGGNPNVSNVYTFLGNGDGTFQAANTLALASNDIGVTSMALADFNNSGNLGVVVGNPDDFTEVLLGNGDGTLVDTALALGQRSATVAAADLLGNGYPEILVGASDTDGQGDSLIVFQNQPTGWATALATPTVTVTPSPSSITTAQSTMVTVTVSGGAVNPTPTGSVILSSGAYTSAATPLTGGSAVITVPGSSLAVATDTLTATYTPDSTSASVYNSAMGTNTVTVTVTAAPSFTLSNSGNISFEASATTGDTATITVTPANGFTGAVNLTCAVTTTPANPTSPATCSVTPSVTITDASSQNATLTVTTATTTTAGAYTVTVTGTSDAIMMPTIVTANVTAYVAPTFTLTNSGAVTISSPGATTGNTATITVTPSGGFTGDVTLTATLASSPSGASDLPTFSFGTTSPVDIIGIAAGTGTLTVTTTAATTVALVRPNTRSAPWYAAGGATLACLIFFGIPARRRRWRSMVGMFMLLALVAMGLVSCVRKSSKSGTTTGNYTITVTGTSGSIMQTTTVSLTVN